MIPLDILKDKCKMIQKEAGVAAEAAHIASGKYAWVNGVRITGAHV
jgi:hypothetical protein